MRIGSTGNRLYSSESQKTTASLKKTNRQLQKILEKLSTAQRINRASDDAAGLSISEQLRTNIRGFKMATQNVIDATAALDISDGAAGRISEIVQRQRELALAARNDTLNENNRKSLDTEYQALSEEIDRISKSTQYNTLNTSNKEDLASGSAIIQAGPAAGDQIQLPEIDFSSIASSLSGTSLLTSAGAGDALAAIDLGMQSLNEQRSTIGATVNRFTSTINNLSVSMINTQAAESVLRDQDMAEGVSQLARQQLLMEGGTAAFARFNEISRYQIMGIIES